MATQYYCMKCGSPYPEKGLPFRCDCGGVFSMRDLQYKQENYHKTGLPGMWKYLSGFDLEEESRPFYLGEGATALVPVDGYNQKLYFKCEHLNPSGSFKDRQSAMLMSILKARGINEILEDSSGNAGASVAHYAAAAGVKNHIFIPEGSSGAKRKQIEFSGAEIVEIKGERINSALAVEKQHIDTGIPYASHAWLPFGLAAYATIAYEIYETLGKMPDGVFAPIGHGSLFLGLLMGFEAIEDAIGEKRPAMIGVQAENCAPVYCAWKGISFDNALETIADGTAVSKPVRAGEIIAKLKDNYDKLLAINEDEVARSQIELAEMGFYVEPTAAMVWGAFSASDLKIYKEMKDVVFILSGNGLKSKYSKIDLKKRLLLSH